MLTLALAPCLLLQERISLRFIRLRFSGAPENFDMNDMNLIGGDVLSADTELLSSDAGTADTVDTTVAPTPNGFERLHLAPELIAAVTDLGYTDPTPVQLQAIPKALPQEGDGVYADLMVSSQTGSGKTAAFLLPVLHTLLQVQQDQQQAERDAFDQAVAEAAAKGLPAPKRPRRKDPTNPRNFKPAEPGALVLCPTRELAQQVAADAIDLVRHCRGLRVANIVGGMPYQLQIAKLQNANLVVATPGRLLDLERSGQIKLGDVKFLVIDEADRMLDLGFSDDLAEVNQLTAQRRQTMMFSATFAPRIQQLAMRVMHDNGANVEKIQIATPQEKHANITQKLFWADTPEHKRQLLDHWLRDTTINQAIVFACTQIECDSLAEDLQQAGFSAVALHGALSQGLRNRRLSALRDGRVQVLVATDVAARGIDVPTISHVFNYGLPMKAEDYTHRIGRTGRAGRDGLAVTIAEMRDRRRIADIEFHTRNPLKPDVIPGLEPKLRPPPSFFARDERKGGNTGGGRGKAGGFGGGGRGGEGRGRFGNDRNNDRSNDRGPRFGDRPERSEEDSGYRSGGFAGFGRSDKAPAGHRHHDAAERHAHAPRTPRPEGHRGAGDRGEVRQDRPVWGSDEHRGPRFGGERSEREDRESREFAGKRSGGGAGFKPQDRGFAKPAGRGGRSFEGREQGGFRGRRDDR
ncbi:MAG: hypothetical protein RLZZ612_498 [Pseudomonadota bacterium]|jgi:superfamily II DNA/RNA helicase